MTKYLKLNSKINKLDPSYIHGFEQLKSLITSHPILKYPDFNKSFKVNTDASNYAIGAVLLQEGHPISYASRTLNTHEIRYSTTEKELLAVVWAVKYFRPYLYGKSFELETDHQALKWLHTKYLGKDLNPRLQRWILSLGEYNIKMKYLKGKENRIADFLSRINKDRHEINVLTETSNLNSGRNSPENDDISIQNTVHSQEENLNDKVSILETIVNIFKAHIILEPNHLHEVHRVSGNKRIFINPNASKKEIINTLKDNIIENRVAIYTEISDHDFYIFQQILVKEFRNSKFIKCTHLA